MIGKRLSEIRKDHSETQADLARELSVSLATVRAWEQGKSSPSHDALATICRMYHVSSDYLLGLTDDDASYFQQRKQDRFTAEERAQIRNFENYLIWKRSKRGK